MTSGKKIKKEPSRKTLAASQLLRKITALLCSACLLIMGLGGCHKQDETAVPSGETLKTVTVGCDTYPPFSYVDVDGNLTGIDIELAREAFGAMGYEPNFVIINWEEKKELLSSGEIDCIWSSYTMDGREDEYQWAGPYMQSHQVVAVNVDSDIYTLQDLEGKVVAVQSTTKPEDIIRSHDGTLPELRKVISVPKRDLIFVLLSKGYADALAAHDTSVEEFMEETGMEFRILDEPLLTVGLGVAFYKDDSRGLAAELNEIIDQMREDGTIKQIIGKYLPNADRYLGGSNDS